MPLCLNAAASRGAETRVPKPLPVGSVRAVIDQYQIRADYDRETIVVYQAYRDAIAQPAIRGGRFVPPYSMNRMTWIKPSFLWLMHRSNWGRKSGQENILAIRIKRSGWLEALAEARLTTGDQNALASAKVHVQWDPERSLRGAALNHYSIQVGIGRTLIERLNTEWTTDISDVTPLARKIAGLLQRGDTSRAKRLLPPERVFPLPVSLDHVVPAH